jgi:hypothetical protein
MSVVEEQAKELGVDAAGGAKDGEKERDTMIVSICMLILIDFLLGGFTREILESKTSLLLLFASLVCARSRVSNRK